jgi:RNA polymerase sigma-70 factor, ECF subfamily
MCVSGSPAEDPQQDIRARSVDLRLLAIEHYDFVWRSLRRLGVMPPDTDDATQQVFLILSRKLSNVRAGDERRYVFSILVYVAANVRRGRARVREREVSEDDAPESSSGGLSAETVLGRAQARAMLDDILARMNDERKTVFVLHELEELTMAEISQLLELPMGTVASRVRRARDDFEAAVNRLRAKKQAV